MFWFRIGILCSIMVVLMWCIGTICGITIMMNEGSDTQSISKDPTLNGTIACYVIILMFEAILMGLCLYGLILSYKTWRNRFQMDHRLRHLFIVWVGCWAACLLCCMSIAIYSIVKGKDPQGQMGYMYEMFQKHTVDQKFVSSFERYQKDNNCCGLYGPDDWLIVQLRSNPSGGGGAGMFQSMDYGFQQNPSTGKCHIVPPTMPTGCGPLLLKQVNTRLGLYGGLIILQVVIGVIAACIAWYCFFYWLEKEVIVIPEDEISNVVIIEPDSSTLAGGSRGLGAGSYMSGGPAHGSSYFGGGSRSRRGSYGTQGSLVPMGYGPASATTTLLPPRHEHHQNHPDHWDRRDSLISSPPRPLSTQSRLSLAGPFDSGSRDPLLNRPNLPPAMLTPSQTHRYIGSEHDHEHHPIPLHHNSYTEPYPHTHSHIPAPERKKETTLDKQLKAMGGKVLAEMHVEHEEDKLKEAQVKGKKKKKKAHHATIALIRKKPVEEPPKHPPGHHGQTGNLAEDIAEMSGHNAPDMIEDVIIPVNPHRPKPPPPPPAPKILGSLTGLGAANTLENLLSARADKVEEEEVKKKVEEDAHLLVKPAHVLPANKHLGPPPPVGAQHGGSEFDGTFGGGSGTVPHAGHYLPQNHHGGHGLGGSEVGAHGAAHYFGGSRALSHVGTAHYLPVNHHTGHEVGAHGTTHYLGGHERANYLPEPHHTDYKHGQHGSTHYLGGHERANYLPEAHHAGHEHGQHRSTHYLGGHERANYLPEPHHTDYEHGQHGSAHYLGGHERANYLPEAHHVGHEHGQHRSTHYLGGHERVNYFPEPHHTDHEHGQHRSTHYLGGHERANYLPPLHHTGHEHGQHGSTHYLGVHERAHYLPENHHRVGHEHERGQEGGGHEHTHYLGGQGRAHYLPENHQRGYEHEHGRTSPERGHGRAGVHGNTHYLGSERPDLARTHYLPEKNQRGGGRGSQERVHDRGAGPPGHHNDRRSGPLGIGHHLDGGSRYLDAGNWYLGGSSQERGRYLAQGHHERAPYLEPGHHGRSRYLEPGHHGRSGNLDPGNHGRTHYMDPGNRDHERSRYLDPGYNRDSGYFPRPSQRMEEPRRSQPPDDPYGGPIGSRRSGSHSHSSRSRRHSTEDANATVLYKNPKRLEDSD